MWIVTNPVHIKHQFFATKNLLVGGKSFFYKSWLDKEICFIRDLMDIEGNLLNFHAFIQSTSIKTNFLQYQGVIECIKKLMNQNKLINKLDKNIIGPIFPKIVQSILKQRKGSQNIYKILNENNDEPTGKINGTVYAILTKSHGNIYIYGPFQNNKMYKA